MVSSQRARDTHAKALLADARSQLLSADEERALLQELADCRAKLSAALAEVPTVESSGNTEPHAGWNESLAARLASDGPNGARLGAIFRRYSEARSRLAMANVRLVLHIARRFRERGIAPSDLIQDGFCGLLEAIDRFDLTHGTKLATYATWWIRQSMQQAVASGAYPVRLTPRHLRQLARCQDRAAAAGSAEPANESIQRIQNATRPTYSLDASARGAGDLPERAPASEWEGSASDEVATRQTVVGLLEGLQPREKDVVAHRYGLDGKPHLSLSQVGKALGVSKERVRQIQDRALEKLRIAAREKGLETAIVELL